MDYIVYFSPIASYNNIWSLESSIYVNSAYTESTIEADELEDFRKD